VTCFEHQHAVLHCCRLDASYEAAVKYVGQFPSPLVSLVSRLSAVLAVLRFGLSSDANQ